MVWVQEMNHWILLRYNVFSASSDSFYFPHLQAKRIQDVMDRDKFALSGMLEVGENLTYISNTVMLSNGTTYPDINCLTIENRIRTKTLSGSSTGSYGGFGKK